MDIIERHLKDNTLHHAYVIIGNPSTHEQLHVLFTGAGIDMHTNPDVHIHTYDAMRIEHARELIETQHKANFTDRALYIIHANQIGEEAQHALLKVFEEPNPHVHFFIILPQDTLLATLRSRVLVLRDVQYVEGYKDFFILSLKDKLAYVKKMTDGIRDEKRAKQDALSLIYAHEQYMREDVPRYQSQLRMCELARKRLLARGGMTKMILEDFVLRTDATQGR